MLKKLFKILPLLAVMALPAEYPQAQEISVPDDQNNKMITRLVEDAEKGDLLAKQLLLRKHLLKLVDSAEKGNRKAYKFLITNANDGDARAQNGMAYYVGRTGYEYRENAYQWRVKSAENGNPDAQFLLGMTGLDHLSLDEALGWLEKAASQGHIGAQFELAAFYTDRPNIPSEFCSYHSSVCYPGNRWMQYPEKGEYWLKKAASNEDSSQEVFVPENKNFQYYSSVAKDRLAFYYINVKKQPEEGLKWLQKAANQCNCDSIRSLARYYQSGYKQLIKKNVNSSLKFYEKWFECLKNKNNPSSTMVGSTGYMLSYHLFKGDEGFKKDIKKSIEYMEKTANILNHNAAYVTLALAYDSGAYGFDSETVPFPVNYAKARHYYEKISYKGYAKMKLGQYYERGKGVRQNLSIAKEWYGKACDQGLELGCSNYARLNSRGY